MQKHSFSIIFTHYHNNTIIHELSYYHVEILYAGELRVSVQVLRESFTECPKFSLTVLSPLETIAEAASSSSLRSGCSKSGGEPLMACVAAYLLHNHEKDSCNLAHLDRVVSGLLQSQPSLCSDWNLSSVIFGERERETIILEPLTIIDS